MLINWTCKHSKDDSERLSKDLDCGCMGCDPRWPLPNLKEADYKEFWGYYSSYSFKADIWLGSVKINGEASTVRVFYADIGHRRGGGFAVAYFHAYQKERVEYYTWSRCEHNFVRDFYRNCYEKLKCTKCGDTYEIYSD